MKNEKPTNIMHKQVQQITNWNRRKLVLLVVLICSAAAMALSFYHFARKNHRLEQFAKLQSAGTTSISITTDLWAYGGSAAAAILLIIVIILLMKEINRRKKINDAVWLQKEYYRITINSIAEGLITTGKNGEILHMNPAAEKITGWRNEEVKNLPLETVYNVTNELTGETFENVVNRILKTGHKVEFENNTLLQTKNKDKVIISNCGSPLVDKRGGISGTVLLFNDITEKIHAENALKQSKEFLQKTLDLSLDIICTINAAGQFVTMSSASKRVLGYEPDELIGNAFINYVAHEDIEKTLRVNSDIMGGLELVDFENHYHHKNGKLVPVQWSAFWDAESKLMFAVARDITEQKKYEHKLKANDAFSRGVLDSLSSHIAVINADGIIIKTNAPWINFAINNGVNNLQNCITGANYFAGFRDDRSGEDIIAAESKAGIKKVLDGTLPEFYLEYPCHYHDQQKWFYMRVIKFESDENLFLIEHHDITERKKAEEETLAAIERYDILAQATSDTIWDWDFVHDKILYNSGVTKMFGYIEPGIVDVFHWWKEKVHPDDFHYVTDAYFGVIKNNQQTIQLEYRFRCADGTFKYIYDRAFVLYDSNKKPVRMIGAMQDVSYEKEEEKRMAKAIMDAQEYERSQIGLELHDNVNQILAGALIHMGMAGNVQPQKASELIEKSKGYINQAVAEIRKLSHRLAPTTFEGMSLKQIFEGVIKSLNVNNQFKYTLHFEGFEGKNVHDDIQINLLRVLQEQLNNIVKYSRASFINIHVVQRDRLITMRIFDNGIGFNISKVKPGIGLANIKKRTESLKGKFYLNSSRGNGCEIKLEIPMDLESC
jgi:two-component system sensor histidine kinase UhpB